MKILILCTGNCCRSQMAHGFLQSMNDDMEIASAGVNPKEKVHPMAVEVMSEIDIDITHHEPQAVEDYLSHSWDYVISVCGDLSETCPAFYGGVKYRLHLDYPDPTERNKSDQMMLNKFRKTRDLIIDDFKEFYNKYIVHQMK